MHIRLDLMKVLQVISFLRVAESFCTNTKILVSTQNHWRYHCHHHPQQEQSDSDQGQSSPDWTTRRSALNQLLQITGATMTVFPQPSWAGEIGSRITQAVTTSDLGISVRTSVVKGAQIMDQLDGQWEQFSDRFGLGSERSKQAERPRPKKIPDPLPLNLPLAQNVLDRSDQVFCAVSGISMAELQAKVNKVATLVKKSFERSGVVFSDNDSLLRFQNGPQFNFVTYAHFKSYSDLIVEKQIPFAPFRTQFETQLGQALLSLVMGTKYPSSPLPKRGGGDDDDTITKRRTNLDVALSNVDEFLSVWRTNGFVALTERTPLEEERISDWLDEDSDLEFSIALAGDITLNAQVLLQEQGFRLYPNFCRYAIKGLMQEAAIGTNETVSAMDYYFDTDYNSDPNKFEVKEVLLSIQLENKD